MSDQLEQLIKEIAAKHGIAVARDDPILVLQTINYRLLQDSAAAQQEQLERFKEEMEGVSMRWQNDAKEKAERIVNAALAVSAQAMEEAMKRGAQTGVDALQLPLDKAEYHLKDYLAKMRLTALCNIVASILILTSTALVILSR